MSSKSSPVHTDVLVIGSGAAGCAAAIAAANAGLNVILLTRAPELTDSNTDWAQGGIIYKGDDDTPGLLASDIIEAGAGVCWPPAVELISREGPRAVEELLINECGIQFDRAKANGDLSLTEEGAHSLPRIIHVADHTGHAIQMGLAKRVESHPRITLWRRATAIDLLTLSHHSLDPLDQYKPPTCFGAFVFTPDNERVVPVLAAETILATGGLGAIFLHTTNPPAARGDGIAMAYRAGARLMNLEYIQFHPTALFHNYKPRFLVSEAVRGEGGVLRLPDGRDFMQRHHPQGSLAPRDIVARAIHTEMLQHSIPCVYLDITHKPAKWLRQRFPTIFAKCEEYGIDMTRQPIPVVPAAHYSCGGVAVDLEGRTSIRRLRAVGEVSCTGVHGANRLASTSLLEAIVWGRRAGADIAQDSAERHTRPYFPKIAPWRYQKESIDNALILQDWRTIRDTMWNYVGLVRSKRRLERAQRMLRELKYEIDLFYSRAALSDDVIGLRNGVQTAIAVMHAAYENRVSRGCHYRED